MPSYKDGIQTLLHPVYQVQVVTVTSFNLKVERDHLFQGRKQEAQLISRKMVYRQKQAALHPLTITLLLLLVVVGRVSVEREAVRQSQNDLNQGHDRAEYQVGPGEPDSAALVTLLATEMVKEPSFTYLKLLDVKDGVQALAAASEEHFYQE